MEANQHIREPRLAYIAKGSDARPNNARLNKVELQHMETCADCFNLYSKLILRLARDEARKRLKLGKRK
jgi:hypothetical protein